MLSRLALTSCAVAKNSNVCGAVVRGARTSAFGRKTVATRKSLLETLKSPSEGGGK